MHVPALQTSPVAHAVPSATFVQVEVLAVGWQLWHLFAGLIVAAEENVPPITHPDWHAPPEQNSPDPQLVLSAR